MDVSLSHTLCLSSIHVLTHASSSSFLSGSALANFIKVCLHRFRPNHARVDTNFGYEHQNFRDAVLGKPSNIVTLEEGTNTVKIADAIIESYTNKSLVKL
jgi:predicted dehydrogenase